MKIQIPIFESHLLPALADGIQKLEFEFSFEFQLHHWNSKTRIVYVYDTQKLEILYISFVFLSKVYFLRSFCRDQLKRSQETEAKFTKNTQKDGEVKNNNKEEEEKMRRKVG